MMSTIPKPIGYESFSESPIESFRQIIESEVDHSQIEVEEIRRIEAVKQHEVTKRAFLSHLRQCHADENLEFVLAVDEYEKEEPKERARKRRQIIAKFLSDEAEKPIGVDWALRQKILCESDSAEPDLFLVARRLVEVSLEHDQLLNFRNYVASRQSISYDPSSMKSVESILKHKAALRDFRKHLESNYCSENLEFILSALEYEQCQDLEKRKEVLQKIVNTFLCDNSDKQISLDWSIHQAILRDMDTASPDALFMAKRMVSMTLEHEHLIQFRNKP